jgi:uncharacterized coiled-coil protein SlyX
MIQTTKYIWEKCKEYFIKSENTFVMKFIKKHWNLLLVGVLFVLTWLFLVLQPTKINLKDFKKHENELVEIMLHRVDARIQVAEKRIAGRDNDIKYLGLQIDSLNLELEKNKNVLEYQLYKLNEKQNNIKVGNYADASDSVLLNKLQSND